MLVYRVLDLFRLRVLGDILVFFRALYGVFIWCFGVVMVA